MLGWSLSSRALRLLLVKYDLIYMKLSEIRTGSENHAKLTGRREVVLNGIRLTSPRMQDTT